MQLRVLEDKGVRGRRLLRDRVVGAYEELPLTLCEALLRYSNRRTHVQLPKSRNVEAVEILNSTSDQTLGHNCGSDAFVWRS